MKNKIIALIILAIIPSFAFSGIGGKRPIPRFVSMKSKSVNVRTGPGKRYPIEWHYINKGEPVEVIAEFEQWRRIRDKFGDGGWVHSSMITGKRKVIMIQKPSTILYESNSQSSKKLAKIGPELRCQVKKCKTSWCQVICKNYKGWVQKENIWGVYLDEIF